MAGSTQCDARERAVRVVDAISILHQEEWGIGCFFESLCPDGVVIVAVIVSTGHGNVEEGTAGELGVEVESLPRGTKIQAESQLWAVGTPKSTTVLTVNFTITIHIHILDVAHTGTASIPGRVVYLFFRAEQPVGFPTVDGAIGGAHYLLPFHGVGLVQILQPACLGVSQVTADGVLQRTSCHMEFIAVSQQNVDTF